MSAVDLGFLLIRVVAGLTFFAHGAQKAFGWWGGPGFEKWTAAMDRMGLRPTRFWAAVTVAAEVVGGLLLAVGLLTPIAAPFLIAQAIYIVFRAHWKGGFFNANRGFEFPLQLLTAAVAFTIAGPGALSLDAAAGIAFSTTVRVVIAAVAIVGALVALYTARPAPAPAAAPSQPPQQPQQPHRA